MEVWAWTASFKQQVCWGWGCFQQQPSCSHRKRGTPGRLAHRPTVGFLRGKHCLARSWVWLFIRGGNCPADEVSSSANAFLLVSSAMLAAKAAFAGRFPRCFKVRRQPPIWDLGPTGKIIPRNTDGGCYCNYSWGVEQVCFSEDSSCCFSRKKCGPFLSTFGQSSCGILCCISFPLLLLEHRQ